MLSDWWNGVELWILGLPFPLQFALAVVVLVPLCLVVAWLIDRIVDHASAFLGPAEPALGSVKPEEAELEKAESETAESEKAEAEATEFEELEESEFEETAEVAEPAAAAERPDERVPAESTGR